MTHPDQLSELTPDELTAVTGGFLPLLGLLGMGANLAGSIMGGIGKKKAAEAQQLTAAGNAAPSSAAAPSTDVVAPRAQPCAGCDCSSSA